MTSLFDQKGKKIEESKDKNYHHLAGLQHWAQQPRLAPKADVKQDKKTRERKEGVASSDERFGDILSVCVQDPISQTNFGDKNSANLQLSLNAGMILWPTKVLKRQSCVSHPWRCALQYLPVAYCSPVKSL